MDQPINMNAYDGVFGADNNYSAIPATMMNRSASSDVDWGAVVTNGIKGAAVNAINTMVNGAYIGGQLQPLPSQQVAMAGPASAGTTQLLLIGAVLWFAFGKAGA